MPRQAPRLSITQKLALNAQLATSIRVLRFDASGLTRYLEEQAGQNPHLALSSAAPETLPWLPRWTAAFAAQGMGGPDATDIGAMVQNPALGLIAHATAQINLIIKAPRDRQIAMALLQSLDPSGWLGRPLSRLAAEAGCTLAQAEAVLAQLQTMEPTGLFARSLAECLRLQAEEAGALDTVMGCILEHLDLLADRQFARLAKMCAVTEAEVSARLRLIRSFDPKPGTRFGQVAGPVREPDLMVVRDAKGWRVSLNRSSLPEVAINLAPQSQAEDPTALGRAREVLRVLNSRNQTLLAVGQEILTRQEAVLAQGLEALKPMGMQEIAVALGLHTSTISRAVAGVSVDTPRGTIWLRALFTRALGPKDAEGVAGDGVAGGALRAHLQRMIAQENPAAPLSDLALAAALSDMGPVARRTVAKYRSLLNIPPAHRRKRRD